MSITVNVIKTRMAITTNQKMVIVGDRFLYVGRNSAMQVGQLIHFDLCDPVYQLQAAHDFFVLFTDDYS